MSYAVKELAKSAYFRGAIQELTEEQQTEFESWYAEQTKDFIVESWHVNDVIAEAHAHEIELNADQAREILALVNRGHDSSIGINWEVILTHTEMYLNPDPKI